MHPSKRKGDSAELEVQGMIREELGVNARRALGAGRKDDMGDIHGVPDTAIQVTNTQDLSGAVTRKLPELERQMLNAGATHGALFCRRRGGTWIVALTPQMWFALMREALELSPAGGGTAMELAMMDQPALPIVDWPEEPLE